MKKFSYFVENNIEQVLVSLDFTDLSVEDDGNTTYYDGIIVVNGKRIRENSTDRTLDCFDDVQLEISNNLGIDSETFEENIDEIDEWFDENILQLVLVEEKHKIQISGLKYSDHYDSHLVMAKKFGVVEDDISEYLNSLKIT